MSGTCQRPQIRPLVRMGLATPASTRRKHVAVPADLFAGVHISLQTHEELPLIINASNTAESGTRTAK